MRHAVVPIELITAALFEGRHNLAQLGMHGAAVVAFVVVSVVVVKLVPFSSVAESLRAADPSSGDAAAYSGKPFSTDSALRFQKLASSPDDA